MTHSSPARGWALVVGWARLIITLIIELLKATWATLKMVYSPPGTARPAILAVPLDTKSPLGITSFANMITLTPGTTTLDVADDETLLYVHALDAPDSAEAVQGMKDSLENCVKRVFP